MKGIWEKKNTQRIETATQLIQLQEKLKKYKQKQD